MENIQHKRYVMSKLLFTYRCITNSLLIDHGLNIDWLVQFEESKDSQTIQHCGYRLDFRSCSVFESEHEHAWTILVIAQQSTQFLPSCGFFFRVRVCVCVIFLADVISCVLVCANMCGTHTNPKHKREHKVCVRIFCCLFTHRLAAVLPFSVCGMNRRTHIHILSMRMTCATHHQPPHTNIRRPRRRHRRRRLCKNTAPNTQVYTYCTYYIWNCIHLYMECVPANIRLTRTPSIHYPIHSAAERPHSLYDDEIRIQVETGTNAQAGRRSECIVCMFDIIRAAHTNVSSTSIAFEHHQNNPHPTTTTAQHTNTEYNICWCLCIRRVSVSPPSTTSTLSGILAAHGCACLS